MADLGAVLSAATDYGNDRAEEEAAPLQVRIAELEARVAELEGGQEPAECLFGSSFGAPIPGGVKVPVGRSYMQPGERPTTWEADGGIKRGVNGTTPDGYLWISPKVSDAEGWFPQLLASMPAGLKVICSPWHEPENDGTTGHSVSDYITAYENFVEYLRPGDELVTVLMKSQTEDINRRYLDAVQHVITGVGFDAYNQGIQTPRAYQDPELVYEKPLRLADEYGKPLWIGETGTGPVGTDVNGQVAWAAAAHNYLLGQSSVRAACWWNSGKLVFGQALFNAWMTGNA